MLPAETIAEITSNLAALNLQPNTAAQILAAVLAPLLKISDPAPDPDLDRKRRRKRAGRPRGRSRAAPRRRRKYKRHAPTEAHDRAMAALRANPEATPTEVAKLAKVSRSTAANAAKHLAREARRKSRATRKTSKTDPKTERRSRAQRFLRETLAQGPKEVQAVEAAAAKAHVDLVTLEQARGDLGVIATRANTGGVHAVQWALPG